MCQLHVLFRSQNLASSNVKRLWMVSAAAEKCAITSFNTNVRHPKPPKQAVFFERKYCILRTGRYINAPPVMKFSQMNLINF